MRIFKLAGALVLVLAFSAVAVATASAAETPWQWLPGSVGETFTGKSGAAELQQKGGAVINCASSTVLLTDATLKVSSELTEGTTGLDAKGGLAVIHFTGCKSLGAAINSDGDEKEIILAHVELKNCMISIAKKQFGILFKTLPIHLEIPAVKQLINVEGSFVAEIKSVTKLQYTLVIEQKEGKQTIEKCEGGEAETLKSKVGAGVNTQSGEGAAAGEITFDMTKDKEGEEMMEK